MPCRTGRMAFSPTDGRRIRAVTPAGPPELGFGLYVHWPFCLAKCPYCDFNSHVRHASRWTRAVYVAAFKREMAWFAERAPKGAP